MRWARGSTTLLTTKHFWTSNLTIMQKICYLCGRHSQFPPSSARPFPLTTPRPPLLLGRLARHLHLAHPRHAASVSPPGVVQVLQPSLRHPVHHLWLAALPLLGQSKVRLQRAAYHGSAVVRVPHGHQGSSLRHRAAVGRVGRQEGPQE